MSSVTDALDVATAETMRFLARVLPAAPADVLEVGCGRGALAAALGSAGHRVVAIDADAGAVEAARSLGVDARVARFPDADPGGTFDAVLFTSSLHHIAPLEATVVRARELLRPRGVLIAEEFAWDAVDRPTAAWAFSLAAIGRAAGVVLGGWESGASVLEAWRRPHAEHGHHGGDAMLDAVTAALSPPTVLHAPYFYRYACRALEGHPAGRAVAEAVLAHERALIEAGLVRAIGLRFVARRSSAEREAPG